jgi:hypothetical protein
VSVQNTNHEQMSMNGLTRARAPCRHVRRTQTVPAKSTTYTPVCREGGQPRAARAEPRRRTVEHKFHHGADELNEGNVRGLCHREGGQRQKGGVNGLGAALRTPYIRRRPGAVAAPRLCFVRRSLSPPRLHVAKYAMGIPRSRAEHREHW